MTAAQPQSPSEAPPPVRGLTREERGRDVSGAQAEAEAQTSKWGQFTEEYAANRAKYAKKT
jgi:hypothetical protein